jgi:1-piperideine-2-carboxylate/1-pyrroline-2-carboxylate reductase [NAD(P)H]
MTRAMRILDASQTALSLPYAQLVPAVATAARELASGAIAAPERLVLPIDAASVLLCMPAIGADIGVTKLITVHRDNARRGLAAIQGEVIVFERSTGTRIAMLDGPTVTARRTAAVSLLGIDRLLPIKPRSALLIGTGVQAAAHADALIDYFKLEEMFVASRNPDSARAFCTRLHARVHARPLGLSELAQNLPDVDVLLTLTSATAPVVPASLAARTLVVGVGAFKPDMAEVPPALLQSRTIVVDHLAGARHEAGDLIQANVDWSQVRELGSILAHGLPTCACAPVFKTVGHAAWDLAAARVATAGFH